MLPVFARNDARPGRKAAVPYLARRWRKGKEGEGKRGSTQGGCEEEEEEEKERPQFRRTIVLLRRKRRKEEFLPRSKLTAALDTAIPSSQFGILRSHSNKMVRDNGAL